MTSVFKKIIIAGGGTAGWMAATLMAHQWRGKVAIELVESDSIGTIGVGEGTTPTIKQFFRRLNIPEQEWMPKCSATYKTGILFDNWSSDKQYPSYFHPFYSPLDNLFEGDFKKNCFLKRQGVDVNAHPDNFIVTSEIAKQDKAPISPATLPFTMTYAYHFDAALLAQFLKEKALSWGVKHTIGTIASVKSNNEQSITSVQLDNGDNLSADIFVDCTGFGALLLGKTLKVPYISFADSLLNDAAVTIRTEMSDEIPSITSSTALSCGWAWKIPLTNRFGNGYVYSSKHLTPEAAEAELKAHLGLTDTDVEANHLKMRVGRFSQGWKGNCIAFGLSQGFIEPLEATALHFVSQSIIDFVDLTAKQQYSQADQTAYNAKLENRFIAIKDYIELHYLTNSRNDTPYWQDARSHQPSKNVTDILNAWRNSEDIYDKITSTLLFEPISWQAMLAGVGTFPSSNKTIEEIPPSYRVDMERISTYVKKSADYFPKHRDALDKLT